MAKGLRLRARIAAARARCMHKTIADEKGDSALVLEHRLRLICRYFSGRLLLNRVFLAEAAQPMDIRLAPKPRHLPFGIVAMRLLRGSQSFVAGDLSSNELQRLRVTERGERSGRFAILVKQSFRFVDQGFVDRAGFKHALSAEVDAFVKFPPIRIEADPQDAKTGERISTVLLPQFGHLIARS